jgi:RHS repeat-associated protein
MLCTELTTDYCRLTTVTGYTGQRNYTYINLLDYGARWYSSSLGRFTQPDSIVPDLTNTQAWNRFSYVMNSPIMYTDPTGHICIGDGTLCTEDPDSNGWWWHESMANGSSTIVGNGRPPGGGRRPTGNPAKRGGSSEENTGANYLHGMSESECAGYQWSQGDTQYCGVYSGVTALSILSGNNFDPSVVSSAIEDSLLGGFPSFNVGLQNGSLIPQIALLITELGDGDYIAVPLEMPYISPEIMEYYLSDPEMVLIVSLTWMTSSTPDIYYGDSEAPADLASGFGGHFMIFAAYDPYHTNAGTSTPYGFINSWHNGGDDIYWMSEDDFSTTWGQYSVFSSIIVRKIP